MDFREVARTRDGHAATFSDVAAVKRIAFLTHEPFYPPSGGGSAEAVYLVEEMVSRGWEVHVFSPKIKNPDEVTERFRIHLHQFTTWEMGRYTKLRNIKYLFYPTFLQKL